MNPDALVIVFPFVPLLAACVSLAVQALLHRDISRPAILASHALQAALAAALIPHFFPAGAVHYIPLSPLGYPIVYAMDRVRVFFLMAYLVPLLFSLFRLRQLESFNLRVLLLFYLGGCSGVIVAGDLFNFFVTYEVMIMAAYVLIGARHRFYASVKYMIFGAVSSAFFLAGIVVLYASGAYLGFGVMERAAELPQGNLSWMLVFFGTAFFIKAAFFPVSAWVATCHSATLSIVSAFLGSFTIFSGIFGIYHLVVVPALHAGHAATLTWIQTISLLTVVIPSVFVLFEPQLKRCVAGSTVYTTGLIGLMLVHGHTEAAFAYMVAHAVYKSLMFYLLDHLAIDGLRVSGSTLSLAAGGACVLFAAGAIPALTYSFKAEMFDAHPGYRGALIVSMAFLLAGFLKFRPRRPLPAETDRGPILLAALLLPATALLIPSLQAPTAAGVARDLALTAAALLGAHPLTRALRNLASIDRTWIFRNLNAELMATLLLFASGVAYLFLL